jgi:hypothetical protein
MVYPKEFSSYAKATIDRALIRAGSLHRRRKLEHKSDLLFDECRSLQLAILSVFVPLARGY